MVRRQKTVATAQVHDVGLDVGYGYTKALGYGAPVLFPSIAGYASDLGHQREKIMQSHPGDYLSDDEGDWFIGRLAQDQLKTAEQLHLRGRTADEQTIGNVFRVRMTRAALGKMFAGVNNGDAVHIRISTGLPVDHMGDAAQLKAALIGQHPIRTDTADFVAHITEVFVMPQPYGTIYSHSLTEHGTDDPCYIYNTTGVVDVGTYTVDVALDEDGEYKGAYSGSEEAGVHIVHERIEKAFQRDFRTKPKIKQIEEIMKTGCFRVSGTPRNYIHVRDEALEPLRAAALNLVNRKWSTGIDLDVIFAAGGGAPLIFDALKAAYPQTQLVKDSQLSNAQGYLNYARFRSEE